MLTDAVSLAGREPAFRDALPVQPAAGPGAALPDLLRRAAGWFETRPPADLWRDGLDHEGALVLARRLLREGAVLPA